MLILVKGCGIAGLARLRALRSGQDVTAVGVGAWLVVAAVRNLVGLASKFTAVLSTGDTAFALKESPVDTDMRYSESLTTATGTP